LEIGRRGGARGAVLLTLVGSVHNPKIMLGMLIKVLCRDSIATRRRLPRESNVTLEDLMRGASDFDVRTVTIETLTSRRHLLPIAVGIITVVTTVGSAGLSCSHDTLCVDAEVGLLTKRAYRNSSSVERVAPLLGTALALSRQHVRWAGRYFQQFFGAMPADADLIDAVLPLKAVSPKARLKMKSVFTTGCRRPA
jgi:hypothetical protein